MYNNGELSLDDHLSTQWLSDSELGVWFASFMSSVGLLTCQKVSTRGDPQILSAAPQRRSVSPHEYVATMRALEEHRDLHGPQCVGRQMGGGHKADHPNNSDQVRRSRIPRVRQYISAELVACASLTIPRPFPPCLFL